MLTFLKSFVLPFATGCGVAAIGPAVAVTLMQFDVIDPVDSERLFVALLLFPCAVAVAICGQRLKKKPWLSDAWSIGLVSGCVAVLSLELSWVLNAMLG
jgi:hypothetical protein